MFEYEYIFLMYLNTFLILFLTFTMKPVQKNGHRKCTDINQEVDESAQQRQSIQMFGFSKQLINISIR